MAVKRPAEKCRTTKWTNIVTTDPDVIGRSPMVVRDGYQFRRYNCPCGCGMYEWKEEGIPK